MRKIVINTCYGSFGLSEEAMQKYTALKGEETYMSDIERDDPILVSLVEKMGRRANTSFSELKVVSIPDDVEWTVEDYDGDGVEWIAEVHRTWS